MVEQIKGLKLLQITGIYSMVVGILSSPYHEIFDIVALLMTLSCDHFENHVECGSFYVVCRSCWCIGQFIFSETNS